jgi:hypothetical protein
MRADRLAADALKPSRRWPWIFPRDPDPDSSPPRLRSCSTCTPRVWQGEPLGENDHVICTDEKTSIQATSRPGSAATQPAPRAGARDERRDEYDRGAIAYLAAPT